LLTTPFINFFGELKVLFFIPFSIITIISYFTFPTFNDGFGSNGLLIFIRLVFFATGFVASFAAVVPARGAAPAPPVPTVVANVVAAYVNQRERLSAFPFVTSRL